MTGRHRARPVRSTGVDELGGWRLKRYEITVDGTPIADEIVEAARRTVRERLPDGLGFGHRHGLGFGHGLGVGFVILHHGTEGVWLLVERWQGDILCHVGFRASLDDPTAFAPIEPGGPTMCVWELEVVTHESAALVRHVLDPVDGPDHDGYLADRIDATMEPHA